MLEMKDSYREKFKDNVDYYDVITQSKHISLIYDLEKEVLI